MTFKFTRLFLSGLFLLCSALANAQTLVHYWNFNNATTETTLLTPNVGAGSITPIIAGSTVIQLTSNTGQGFDVTNPNARNGDTAGTHLRFNNPIGSQLEFSLPTTGFNQVIIKYGTRRSGSGAGIQYIHYTTNGTSYQLFDSLLPLDADPNVRTLDFSAIAAVNNNAQFKIRISFAAGSGGTVGNNRFDNFTLDGTPLSTFVPYTLQILHASDMEGGLDAPKDAPNFAAVIDSLEGTYANTVILSSGDNVIPSPFLSAGEDPSIQTPLRTATSLFYPGSHAVRPAIGRSDIAILNLIGFNASVFGNHEFDLGTGELNSIIGVDIRNSGADKRWVGAQFPFLSANLNFSADANLSYLVTPDGQADTSFRAAANITANSQKKGIARSAVITRGGQKIGIVGATTQVLASISSPGATTMVGPSVNDMPALAAILQPVIDSLRIGQGINKIIVLSHLQQLSLEQALAPLLTGVDVIIAGGSHSLLADANDILRPGDVAAGTYPQIRFGTNGQPTLLVNTAAEYRYVGRLVVAFDSLGVIDTTLLNPMINGAYATDSAGVARVWGNYASALTPGTKGANVKALTDAMQTVIVAKDGNVFGKASVFLEGRREFTRTEETNLGNLTSDANLWQARQVDPTVTLSLKNGGGIRQAMGTVNATGSSVILGPTAPNPAANKQAGDISQLDIENSLRFNNRLSVMTIPVTGIKDLLEHGVAQTAPGATPGRFPQVGGMAFSYDPTQPVNSRIRSVVRIDSANNIIDTLVRNGQIHGNPNRTYKLVTLNFLAGGGDGYPFAPYAASRINLDTVITALGTATFTVPGSEQDAFAEFMVTKYPASNPYSLGETAAAIDFRIQDLTRRTDGLFPFDFANLLLPANNTRLVTSPTNSTAVQISWTPAIGTQSYKWSLDTLGGAFAPGLVNLASNNNGTDTTLTLTVSTIDSLLASLGVAPGDSINTRWTVKAFVGVTDSSLATAFNLKLVRDAQISNFNLLTPANNARLEVRGPASTPVNITWQTATSPATAPIRYTWLADPAANFNSPLLQFASDNQGANTQLSLTTGIIDSLLNLAGVPIGDSITISWTVSARSGISSKLASIPQQLKFIRVGLTSSVQSIELSKVRMYPNPSEGEVTLETNDLILWIVVRDLLGAEVLRMQPNEATVKLQLQHLPASMYLIQGETRQGSFNERVLLKR